MTTTTEQNTRLPETLTQDLTLCIDIIIDIVDTVVDIIMFDIIKVEMGVVGGKQGEFRWDQIHPPCAMWAS